MGLVIVTKSPSYSLENLRVLKAVGVDDHELARESVGKCRNCIFFSTNGDRPEPDKVGNSDLDGDEYMVLWDPRLLQYEKEIREAAEEAGRNFQTIAGDVVRELGGLVPTRTDGGAVDGPIVQRVAASEAGDRGSEGAGFPGREVVGWKQTAEKSDAARMLECAARGANDLLLSQIDKAFYQVAAVKGQGVASPDCLKLCALFEQVVDRKCSNAAAEV